MSKQSSTRKGRSLTRNIKLLSTNKCLWYKTPQKNCEGEQPAPGYLHAEVTIPCKTGPALIPQKILGKIFDCKLGTYNTFPSTNLYKYKDRSSSEIDSRKVLPNRLCGVLLPVFSSNNNNKDQSFACPSLFLAHQASILLTTLQSSSGSFTRSPSPITSHRAAGWRSMCTARTKWWGDMMLTGCDGAPVGLLSWFPGSLSRPTCYTRWQLNSSEDRSTESEIEMYTLRRYHSTDPVDVRYAEMKTGTQNTLSWGPHGNYN